MDVIDIVDVQQVDLVAPDEMLQIDHVAATATKLAKLLGGQGDIARILELMAFDQGLTRDDVAGLGIDELFRDRIARPCAQQVKLDAR